MRGGAPEQIDFMHYMAWKWSLMATILGKKIQIALLKVVVTCHSPPSHTKLRLGGATSSEGFLVDTG